MKASDLIQLLQVSITESGDQEVCFALRDQEWYPIDAIVRVRHKETNQKLLIITNDESGATGKAPMVTLVATGDA